MKTISDPKKAEANRRKHGLTFAEGAEVFDDPLSIEQADERHAGRLRMTGRSYRGRILVVVYSLVAEDLARLISVRLPSRHERSDYEEETQH